MPDLTSTPLSVSASWETADNESKHTWVPVYMKNRKISAEMWARDMMWLPSSKTWWAKASITLHNARILSCPMNSVKHSRLISSFLMKCCCCIETDLQCLKVAMLNIGQTLSKNKMMKIFPFPKSSVRALKKREPTTKARN